MRRLFARGRLQEGEALEFVAGARYPIDIERAPRTRQTTPNAQAVRSANSHDLPAATGPPYRTDAPEQVPLAIDPLHRVGDPDIRAAARWRGPIQGTSCAKATAHNHARFDEGD